MVNARLSFETREAFAGRRGPDGWQSLGLGSKVAARIKVPARRRGRREALGDAPLLRPKYSPCEQKVRKRRLAPAALLYREAILSISSSTACCWARGKGLSDRAKPRNAQ